MSDVPGTSPGNSFSGERLKAFAADAFRAAAWAYVAFLVGATGLLWWGGDHWWPGTILLFGPRWILGLPLVLLVPASFRLDPQTRVLLAIGVAVFLFPLLGLNLGIPRRDRAGDLGVLTINVADGRNLKDSIPAVVASSGADIVALQECPRGIRAKDPGVEGYEFHSHRGLCLFSRLQILDAELAPFDPDFPGAAARYTLETSSGDSISFTNLHLPTPRAGLEDIREGIFSAGIGQLVKDTDLRVASARTARELVDGGGGPRVVVGDFNAPPESRIQREIWGDFGNAFDRAGLGFGFTRYNGWIRARIDHVLIDHSWTVAAVRVGEDVGSDHRPLVVRLRLKQ